MYDFGVRVCTLGYKYPVWLTGQTSLNYDIHGPNYGLYSD